MLALDDKRWALLGHAYGKADDVPEMIRELEQLPKIDLEENQFLYGYLCHQYTTYSATYAAIPYLVEIAFQENQTLENKITIVEFCGDVHALRNWDKRFHIYSDDENLVKELSLEIEEGYSKAIQKIKPLAEQFLANRILGEEHRFYMFYMFLAFEGFEDLSRIFILSNFTEFYFHCPNCKYEHFIYQDDSKMKPDTEDYDFELNLIKINLENLNAAPSKELIANWTLFYAQKYDVKPVKYQIPYLFGTMICPHCNKEFRIIDALSQEIFGSKHESF